jgi:hypothetical protein
MALVGKPPLKLWQGALIALFVAVAIWCGYVVYHIYWGALAH